MRRARLFLPVLLALTAAACAREQQPAYYVIDPATGQPVPVVQHYTPPQYGAYGQYVQPSYGQPAYTQPQAPHNEKRGLLTAPRRDRGYAAQPYPQPYGARQVYQPYSGQPYYGGQSYQGSQQPYAQQAYPGNAYAAAPNGYAYAPSQPAYTLDSGDRLRIVVFGQEGITGSYLVDAGGNVSLPLIGIVPARGYTTPQLASMIGNRLKQGYVREPHVTVAVESYRPFFILGEVNAPGQYPYVAHMTAENAVAIAGGFAPRAEKDKVELTRNYAGRQIRTSVPLSYPLQPGDTVVVKERWF